MAEPFISICIPAYKRVEFLKRLLDSISIQRFKDYEIILSDDSPASEVRDLLQNYHSLPVNYVKNPVSLGTPANWNNAIRLAKGKWIKLMHDDDWFASAESLEEFALAARNNENAILFSAYSNFYFGNGKEQPVHCSASSLARINREANTLIAGNVVGPPSVIMHRNDGAFFYDERLKWLVDIDYYISRANEQPFVYIDKILVKVGIGEEQVTQDCFRVPEVELPEHYRLLQKTGTRPLGNILIYDAWWRLFRNLGVYDEQAMLQYVKQPWPPLIYRIMKDAGRVKKLISFGPVSKLLMAISFLRNRKYIG